MFFSNKQRLFQMQQLFNLTLPLLLGADIARQYSTTPDLSLKPASTAEIECSISLPTSTLQGLYKVKQKCLKLPIISQAIKDNLLCIKLGQSSAEGKGLHINGRGVEKSLREDIVFPFRIAITTSPEMLMARITKLIIEFKLMPLPKAKFVKNERLQGLDRTQENEWGLLTMDKAQRIVLEDKCSDFPAIGMWLTGKPLDSMQLAKKLVEYCSLKLDKKCKFIFQNNKYFYLVTFPPDNKTPDLYLVHWTPPKETYVTLQYPIQEVYQQEVLFLRSDEHSHLEFTLRSDQKIPQKLQNIECSPISFDEDTPSLQVEYQEPNSPRFKNNPYDSLEIECASLRRLVRLQQQEINELRSELMRVTKSIRQSQNKRTYQAAKTSRASRGKILTQKDLSLGSPSDPPSTSNSSSEVPQDWNAWDKFEIVDK